MTHEDGDGGLAPVKSIDQRGCKHHDLVIVSGFTRRLWPRSREITVELDGSRPFACYCNRCRQRLEVPLGTMADVLTLEDLRQVVNQAFGFLPVRRMILPVASGQSIEWAF